MMKTQTSSIAPLTTYQTWAFTVGPDHHNTRMTHATKGVSGKTLCGRQMYGYLETDLTRYGISCRVCKKAAIRLLAADGLLDKALSRSLSPTDVLTLTEPK